MSTFYFLIFRAKNPLEALIFKRVYISFLTVNLQNVRETLSGLFLVEYIFEGVAEVIAFRLILKLIVI